jgi:hypothetical protein
MGLVIQELEKIETQHGDNETTIKRHGGALGERLDDGLSAWKLGVRRPDFSRRRWRMRARRVPIGPAAGGRQPAPPFGAGRDAPVDRRLRLAR